ncbi:hypothetical protein CIG75_01780 [Tumebacillus algifaecis]|uniref:Uncharacterized protein n=1 Tax=Tumebacillus algifaecis TaxID=1214604 RepID=A0A223CX85_9BACL|nr:hypothetical protein [Tumebacillus algifaecis]ASS73825.1 hypothetical protein CIG75_01780 [Tumebacillus algifaecis]
MKKLIGFIFLSTVAVVTVLATPQGDAQAWWTDFGPNVTGPETLIAEVHVLSVASEVVIETEPTNTCDLWWTDHGPNH